MIFLRFNSLSSSNEKWICNFFCFVQYRELEKVRHCQLPQVKTKADPKIIYESTFQPLLSLGSLTKMFCVNIWKGNSYNFGIGKSEEKNLEGISSHHILVWPTITAIRCPLHQIVERKHGWPNADSSKVRCARLQRIILAQR